MIPMITDHYIFVDQSLVLRETTIVGTDNKTYKEKFFFNGTAVSMGNPHFVVFVPDVDALDLEDLGPQFEHHKLFPEGVNTEFVQIIDENTVGAWQRRNAGLRNRSLCRELCLHETEKGRRYG